MKPVDSLVCARLEDPGLVVDEVGALGLVVASVAPGLALGALGLVVVLVLGLRGVPVLFVVGAAWADALEVIAAEPDVLVAVVLEPDF